MKSYFMMLIATLALTLGEPLQIAAQITNSVSGTYGMFGYRSIGGPSYPVATTGMFGPRTVGGSSFGIATTGMFGYRFTGPAINSFTLGIQNGTGATLPYPGQSAYTTYTLPSGVMPAVPESNMSNMNNMPEQPVAPEVVPQPSPATNGTEGMAPVEQGPGAPAGIATPAAANVTFPRGWSYASSTSTAHSQSFTRSTELSDRLTQIAHDKGMLAGQRIDVSLHGDIAVLQGKVRTSGERVLLANVLSLEPRVRWIDNRLITEEDTANSSNQKSR